MSDFNISPEFEEKVREAVSAPNAKPEFVNQLRNELARRPVEMKPTFIFRPAWAIAFVLALAVMVMSVPGVAAAIGRLFGYVPEVGLVENTGNLRILAEPVSLTRESVTLTITSVFVYADHVELIYDVKGIAPANDGWQQQNASEDPTAFCGGVNIGEMDTKDGDAVLRLPDGTIVERILGSEYPQNVFATKPVYKTSIPLDVMEMTMILDCIPMARRGAVPENWEVPFKLVEVPEGTVVGAPVINVEPTVVQPAIQPSAEVPGIPAPVVTITLTRVVPLDSRTIFYFSMDMENKDPSLASIMPLNVYLTDSLGQKSQLIGNFTWQPFEHRAGSDFEFMSQAKPAPGPLTLMVENAVAYYAPLHVEPRQATPAEMEFIFDAGENPQPGQTWNLNHTINVAGYPVKITSARATTYDEVAAQYPAPPGWFDSGGAPYFDSQGFLYGYDFTLEMDPSVKMLVEMDIMSETPVCGLSAPTSLEPESNSIHYIKLCRDEYPKGNVKVQLWELAVLVENSWQATWTPPAQ